jgi:DNA (cytosine-5)-methyltransferase 1
VTYTFADCLGFAGGFTLGVVQAGFELIAKRELTGGFGVPNCEANRALLGDRWRTEVGAGEEWSRVDADAVIGNPPCSGFSVMTDKRWRGVDAKINACMWSFSNYVAAVRPQIAVMESVRVAYTTGRPLMQQLRDNVESKTGLRYDLWHVFQNALELGGAGQRPRYFMVMSQLPFGVEYPRVHPPVLRDVIEDLEGLNQTWELQPYRRPPTWWSKQARSDAGVVDGHVGSNSPYVQRARELLEANGEWPQGWAVARVLRQYYDKTGTVPPLWQGQLQRLIEKDWFMGFTTMVRWREDRPARVITGAALQSVLHPWLPRTITNRECARIMGFPDDWRLLPLKGNAVSPTHGKGITVQCGRWIGDWMRRALDGTPGVITGEPVGDREFFITAPRSKTATPGSLARREDVNQLSR